MDKKADHLRRVQMPGDWKQREQPNVLSDESTDFGFGNKKTEPTQESKEKPTTLDQAYEFWNGNRSPANMDQLLQAARPVINKAISSFAGGNKALVGMAKRLAI